VPNAHAQSCAATYAIQSAWPGNFSGVITVNNTGTSAINGWTLTWTYGGNQQITQLWNGNETQAGQAVTVTNMSYNGSIAAGGTYSGMGFNASVTGTNAAPAITCTAAGSIVPTPGFTLSASPVTVSAVQGASGSSTIAINPTGGFNGAVAFSASGLPSGVTASFNPGSTTGSSSVVTFSASATATPGTSTVTITGTSGTLTASTPISLTVIASNPIGSFKLAPSASTLSIAQSASGTDTITITDVSPFSGSVTLAASGLPTGVTAAFGTNPATSSSVVTFAVGSSAVAASYPIIITGTSGTLTASTTITLTITSGTCTPTAITPYLQVNGGAWQQATTATVASGATVNLGPQPLSGTWSWTGPNGFTSSARQINSIPLTTGANAYVATYTNSSSCKSTQAFAITVTGAGSFTLAPAASTLSIAQGASGTDSITITDVSPFTGSVTLAASGLPTGVTAVFGTNPATSSSIVTFTASSTAVAGSYPITITGTSGTLTATTTITITITTLGTGGFSIAASPVALSIVQGGTGTDTITVTDISPFKGSVTLAVSGLPIGVTAVIGTNPTTSTSVVTFTVAATATAATSTITVTGTSGTLPTSTATIALTVTPQIIGTTPFEQHFLDLYADYHNSANGYFSPQGIPYHSVETLMVEAPDYGHETVSETYSYWIWLEALYGNFTKNWTPLQTAWTSLETNMIPSATLQPTNSNYNPNSPATYAPEWPTPNSYPSMLNTSVAVGSDPLASQLSSTYGNNNIYAMHWIIDTDNWYGYGQQEDGVSKPSCINTFQRGATESVWLTVPQPCWDALKFGGPNGYLDLFTAPAPYAAQWKYTDAPDADARAVQAIYWAQQYANAQGGSPIVTSLLPKAAKLGDYLRYAFFDKYFKTMGCTSINCPAGNGYNSAHYLLSWYYAWGGAISQNWAWRIGDGAAHFGYQNPVAAYALSTDTGFALPAQSKTDWATSLERQLEFYRWLQSNEGAIAGGATNSWGGQYAVPPAGDSTFYSMAYDWEPVYHSPPSNQWFGMQVWSMERVAEYYYITGDAKAKTVLDPWIAWVSANTSVSANGTYTIPETLTWTGQPTLNWSATNTNWTTVPLNTGLHVTVASTTSDIGMTGSLAKALSYYSAGTAKWATQDVAAETLAKTLLTDVWTNYRDSIGISAPEARTDYSGFNDAVYIPAGWGPGTMPNGDPITTSSTFLSLRTQYEKDPAFPAVQAYLNGGAAPTFNYHRFWAQVDIASAYAVFANLFPGN